MKRVDHHLDEADVWPAEERAACSPGDFVSFTLRSGSAVDGLLRQKTTRGWAYVDAGSREFPVIWRVPFAALNLIAREVS